MARAGQKEQSLKEKPHRCPCGRVAKVRVGPEGVLACALHTYNAIRNVILDGHEGTVVEVTAVEGQL
jgi:hypothetical protein